LKKQPRQPQPTDVQELQQLVQGGQLLQAEVKAQALLAQYPNELILYNLLGFCQQGQGKNREAVISFRKMLAIEPRVAEIHFHVAVILGQLGDNNEAIASYRNALQLKPDFTAAHFNLGTLLQAQASLQEAAGHYRKAIALEPGFFEALANLGTVLQHSGQLAGAEHCYRKALAVQPDARGYVNLGTVLYGQGKHDEAVLAFRDAIKIDPHCADAWNNLGETLRDSGEMTQAVKCYEQALVAQPQHSRAKYNLGEYFCLAGNLLEAVAYFESSDFTDAKERVLQCLYKTRQFEYFKQKFDQLTAHNRHTSVLLATLSMHYALNFGLENSYCFCQKPMDYVLHSRIDELAAPNSPFLTALLHDIQHLAITERKQGRLYYGTQSAGNLLMRPEPSFQKLAALIRQQIVGYQKHYAESADELIASFPHGIEFASSWYLRMKQGGYLTSHIHEEGWISGCVYLKLPTKNTGHEGSFAYGTDGDDYPRLHDHFPSQIVDLQVGDVVLFPSSLFHRTLPFHADQDRVCVAFDVKPIAVTPTKL
jgi:tetratricopeptide (TPR) repeat protein